jgi:ABC-type transport system involved in multi-copper enzyme maturation permease subunit
VSKPPPVPALGSSIATVFWLTWVRLVRGKKLRVGLAAVALIVVAITGARYAVGGDDPSLLVREGIALGFFNMLVYLIPFLLTAGTIAEEVESRTFTYVASRPVSRFALTVGKFAAGVAMSVLLLVASLLLLHVACYITVPTALFEDLGDTARAAGALALLATLYGAICMFWGAVASEAAGIVSALYLGVMEFGFGKLPFFLRFVSLNFHATELAGLDRGGLLPQTVPDFETWIAAAAIPTFTIVWLLLAALVVSTSEYRFGRA